MITLPPEKLGSFYLGAEYDIDTKELSSETVNYDSRDLTTHAICVGMTGSGKTGLCIGLLEEAAIDKVPAIIIDPKGDMTNLMLQFEDLAPSDFEQWINPDDAARKGMTVQDYAADRASKWEKGLASWGQDKERIRSLKSSVDYTIFTPGSNSGIPINIMGSFAAPGIDFDSNSEMLHERIQGTVAALLGMIGSKEDPVRSKEGILLSNIFEHYWRTGEDLDIGKLILAVQTPPMKKLGVFDIDTFFPEKERFNLAMDFNSLLASPQFKYWMEGEPLDINKIYYTPEGKPRHSIFYIAHLSESERMFFVTLLLNSLITWMRSQSGTSSLRSLLYFDEIFGYFPPTAEPPSKKPLLTILKQARAFGVGAVLVTQNPVDIDYKGLSNAGTWFIGKLQTERDKMRVLDGLQGAIAEAGNASDSDFDKIISKLSLRNFLLHNVHDSEPLVFQTRWVMSYLRGPLTRPQVKQLMAAKKDQSPMSVASGNFSSITATEPQPKATPQAEMPTSIDPSIEQKFFTVRKSAVVAQQDLGAYSPITLIYKPQTLAIAKVRYYDDKRRIDEVESISLLATPPDEFNRSDWDNASVIRGWERAVLRKPDFTDATPVKFDAVPDSMNTAKEVDKVEKELSNWLYQTKRFNILEHDKFDLYQEETETAESFRMRVAQRAREERDEEMDKLQDKYVNKFEKIRDYIRREEHDLEEAQEERSSRKTQEVVGVAETIFGVLLKRRRSRSMSGYASRRRMSKKAALKVEESQEELEELHEDYADLEIELKDKLDDIARKWDKISEAITAKEIKPRRTDVKVDSVILCWHPYWRSEDGREISALS